MVVDSTSRASFIYFQRDLGIYMRREVYQIHDTLLVYHNATWLFRINPDSEWSEDRIHSISTLCENPVLYTNVCDKTNPCVFVVDYEA